MKKHTFLANEIWITTLTIFFTLTTVQPARAAERVALVIGNSNYAHVANLANPVNDAKAISDALSRLDFQVVFAKDLKKADFERRLLEFSDMANGAKIALVYYAGHGLERNGRNYLIPVDARLKQDHHVTFECVSLDYALNAVDGAKVLKLVLLDACRDNPFVGQMKMASGTRSIGRGLAVIEPRHPGMLISYAAAAGTTADDGSGAHSPYTEGLLKYLEQPGLEVNLLFRKVAGYVQKKTGGKQTPFEYGRLPDESIYLKMAEKRLALIPNQTKAPVVTIDPCRDASAHWAEIKDQQSKALLEEHLRLFGDCAFATLARQKLEAIRSSEKPQEAQAPETECDRLAAHPEDPFKIASVKGINLNQIKLPDAEIACKKAVKTYPNTPRLQYQYGRALNKTKKYDEALRWYHKAADLGYAAAMSNIGWSYDEGHGVTQDYDEAMKWYRKAADLGNAAAMRHIGCLYAHGQGVTQDYDESMKWYRKAADLEDATAINNIGALYGNGQGVTQDYDEALKWYRKASNLGNALAMSNIGWFYEKGHGVPQDYDEAMKWYRKAADLGNAAAMRHIGYLYNEGHGVPQDYDEALKWYRKAVDLGDAMAMNNIAACYKNGEGVPKDAEEAARWMEAALRAGCEFSRKQMRTNLSAWPLNFRTALQKRLKVAGVYHGRLDGVFGPETQRAIDAIFNKT